MEGRIYRHTETLYPTFLIISQIVELLKHLPIMMNGRKGRRRLLQPYPKHSPIITPITYKAVIIPQPIITPLPPAVAYLIGALGVKMSSALFSD
mgnify:CR=1 FL=1